MRRPSGPLGILLTVTGVCAVLITPVVVGFVLWLNHRPPDIKGLVKSPDGRWEAYIACRGFLDNTKGCLYVRAKGGQVVGGPQIWGSDISIGKLVWSPDSRRVAWILWSQVPYQVDSIYVFDLQARRPQWAFDPCQGKKLSADDLRALVLKWADADMLSLVIADPEHAGEPIAYFRVSDGRGERLQPVKQP